MDHAGGILELGDALSRPVSHRDKGLPCLIRHHRRLPARCVHLHFIAQVYPVHPIFGIEC